MHRILGRHTVMAGAVAGTVYVNRARIRNLWSDYRLPKGWTDMDDEEEEDELNDPVSGHVAGKVMPACYEGEEQDGDFKRLDMLGSMEEVVRRSKDTLAHSSNGDVAVVGRGLMSDMLSSRRWDQEVDFAGHGGVAANPFKVPLPNPKSRVGGIQGGDAQFVVQSYINK
jgi:hypothetical protein